MTIDSKEFKKMKQGFDFIVINTINAMKRKKVDYASIELKLEIKFLDKKTGEEDNFLSPMFKYKIVSFMDQAPEPSKTNEFTCCKDCKKRVSGCHDTCEDYQVEHKKLMREFIDENCFILEGNPNRNMFFDSRDKSWKPVQESW